MVRSADAGQACSDDDDVEMLGHSRETYLDPSRSASAGKRLAFVSPNASYRYPSVFFIDYKEQTSRSDEVALASTSPMPGKRDVLDSDRYAACCLAVEVVK